MTRRTYGIIAACATALALLAWLFIPTISGREDFARPIAVSIPGTVAVIAWMRALA
jgi:hypothetical protein